MIGKSKNLHFFENITIKRQFFSGRTAYFLLQLKKACLEYKLLMLAGGLSLLVFSTFVFSLLGVRGNILGRVLAYAAVLESIFFCALCLLFKLGYALSQRFLMKLFSGIRDATLFLLPLSITGLHLINLFPGTAPVRYSLAAFLFIFFEVTIWLAYEIRIAPKKQHDLDIPRLLPADSSVDITVENGVHLVKKQVAGDTRNVLEVNGRHEAGFRIKKKCASLKLAVAVSEFADACAQDIKLNLYLSDGRKQLLLLSKVMNTKENYEDREWNEVEIALDWRDIDFADHHFSVQLEKNTKEGGAYLSEPRVSGSSINGRKIIFVVFDALRYDHLSSNGYTRSITPYLDIFSHDAAIFKNSIVQGEWTLTSFMSFLTSLYPSSHGVFHPALHRYLPSGITTLPQLLREGGFITKGYFTHRRVVSNFGFARGFDSHIFRQCDKESKIGNSDDLLLYATDTLNFHRNDDLFLMLHFFDSHQPCNPPSPYADLYDKTYGKKAVRDVRTFLLKNKNKEFQDKDVANLIARYDAEITRLDLRFGMLIDYLKSSGQYDETMIIFTADHGMVLNDHRDISTIQLFDETLRVPLFIKFPRSISVVKPGLSCESMVESNLDIMPTILDVYAMAKPSQLQGKSLLDLLKGRETKDRDYAVSESFFDNTYSISIRDSRYRYLAKADFDFSAFSNIDFRIKTEKLYSIQDGRPAEIEISEEEERNKLIKVYREIAIRHVNAGKNMAVLSEEGEPKNK